MISASFDSGIRGSPLRGGKPAGGSGKSWTFATVLITRAAERRLRILVADELVAEYTARRVGVVRRRPASPRSGYAAPAHAHDYQYGMLTVLSRLHLLIAGGSLWPAA
jgi:hypothetical protein